jgi:hypothetical protein
MRSFFSPLIDEHRHWPTHGAAHLKHLLQRVARRIFEIDQNDIGIDGVNALQEIMRLANALDLREASLTQSFFKYDRADRAFIDDDDLQRVSSGKMPPSSMYDDDAPIFSSGAPQPICSEQPPALYLEAQRHASLPIFRQLRAVEVLVDGRPAFDR